MRDLNVRTTNTRRGIHAAALKANWREGNDGPRGDELIKGDYRINISYDSQGRLSGAYLSGPLGDGVIGELDETKRFGQIILWIGGVK